MTDTINISLEDQFKKRERAQKHYIGNNNWDTTQGTVEIRRKLRKKLHDKKF